MKNQSSQKALFEIADLQQGYFTAKQAISAGFASKNHHYYVRAGHWIREGWGIYRLSNYPFTDRPDLMLWYLWSRNKEDLPQGVFSHATALSIYDLSDSMPAKLHMTVPKKFRKMGKMPEILHLYKRELPTSDQADYIGIKITTPLRTLIDIVEAQSLSEDLIRQAFKEGVSRGMISKNEILKHPYVKQHPEITTQIKEYF